MTQPVPHRSYLLPVDSLNSEGEKQTNNKKKAIFFLARGNSRIDKIMLGSHYFFSDYKMFLLLGAHFLTCGLEAFRCTFRLKRDCVGEPSSHIAAVGRAAFPSDSCNNKKKSELCVVVPQLQALKAFSTLQQFYSFQRGLHI